MNKYRFYTMLLAIGVPIGAFAQDNAPSDEVPEWLIAVISILLIIAVIYISLKASGKPKKKTNFERKISNIQEDKKDKELFLRDE